MKVFMGKVLLVEKIMIIGDKNVRILNFQTSVVDFDVGGKNG